MNENEKRKVFEELLERYQDYIESEFSYEDGKREAERKAWLNKYDGIQEPLIKDEKIRKAVRAWAEANNRDLFIAINEHFNCCKIIGYTDGGDASCDKIEFSTTIAGANKDYYYTIAELCGEEEE